MSSSFSRNTTERTRNFLVVGLCLAILIAFQFLSHSDAVKAVRHSRAPEVVNAVASTTIVISQVYGGGGNGGSTYKNDFIELFNLGTTTVSVAGWSVQYASAAGTTWQATNLSGSIAPGQYYLVQEAQGAGGTTNLPTPDATGTTAMSATSAKVALVNSTTALSGACPVSATIVDLFGYGTANCFEAAATAALTNTTAALRNNNGCTDTDNNSADFTLGAPNPRNTATSLNPCAGGGGPIITNSSPLPNATVGTPYSVTFTATSGSGSGYTFLLLSGTLPPGLTLSGAVLSGTPSTISGSPFNFTIQVTDSASATGSKSFQLSVGQANACAAPSPQPQSCGVERWSVKTGTDADVASVNLNSATPTSIATLRALAYPSPSPPSNNRVAPAETTQWVIQGTLVQYKLESDSDYHVVIQDGAGNSMVTEIPYPGSTPACVITSSPFLAGISSARCTFDTSFTATTSFQTANIPVRITGIGMFDFAHGQTGAAPNQIELHPIVDIAFPATSNAPTATGSNVNVQNGDASITFTSVSGAGTTTSTPIDPSAAGTAPSGFTLTGPAYDFTTTATESGTIGVCIQLPYITDASAFSRLHLLHGEGGTLIDRTSSVNFSSKVVCGNLPSLSPVVIALASAPTASASYVSGRLTNQDGTPVEGAVVNLNGGQTRRTITDLNGNYRFADVETNRFYSVTPSRANYTFNPAQRMFSQLGNHTEAAFTGLSSGDRANPLDTAEYFVRQQYLDFLDREPDEAGFNFWSDQINQCLSVPPASTASDCLNTRRREVAAAFFISNEFQESGYFVYRLYKASLGVGPAFAQYLADRNSVIGGASLTASRAALLNDFVERAEFLQAYPASLTSAQFVNKLYDTAGLYPYLLERQIEINHLNTGGMRSQVLQDVIEDSRFKSAEYNSAFVLAEYFGYLRRNPDPDGYDFWLNVLNAESGYRGMVCSFITSAEYQRRFGSVISRSNSECR
jgi:hypothetical protein